jgi:DNA repair protein RadC
MKTPRIQIAKPTGPTANPKCTDSGRAVAFWRAEIASKPRFNARAESYSVLTLDKERRFTDAHAVASRSFGNAQRFTDELFQADFLRGVSEWVLIHHRPGVALVASADDLALVAAVILAGRARKTELLDALIIGTPDDVHLSGTLSFRKIRGFTAEIPFAETSKKAVKTSAKPEAQT